MDSWPARTDTHKAFDVSLKLNYTGRGSKCTASHGETTILKGSEYNDNKTMLMRAKYLKIDAEDKGISFPVGERSTLKG